MEMFNGRAFEAVPLTTARLVVVVSSATEDITVALAGSRYLNDELRTILLFSLMPRLY